MARPPSADSLLRKMKKPQAAPSVPIAGNMHLPNYSGLQGADNKLKARGYTTGSIIFIDSPNLAENNTQFFWDKTNFRLGIGTNTPSESLDLGSGNAITTGNVNIDSDANGLILGDGQDSKLYFTGSLTQLVTPSGAMFLTGSEADNTNKTAILGTLAYDTDQVPYNFFLGTAQQTINAISFGGGAAGAQACTLMQFFTAAAVNTEAGSLRMIIKGDGNVGINEGGPDAHLHITESDASSVETIRLDNLSAGNNFGNSIKWYGAGQAFATGELSVQRNGAGLDFDMKFKTTPNITTTDAITRMTITGNGLLDMNAKSGMSPTGGIIIKLTNKTGGNTVQGQLAAPYSATAVDDAFKIAALNSDEVFGIVLEAGVADGSEAWIVISGIADVLMDAGGSARGDRLISSGNAGFAGSADVWNVGGAVATHFQEIGHSIETRVGAGLSRAVLHFN